MQAEDIKVYHQVIFNGQNRKKPGSVISRYCDMLTKYIYFWVGVAERKPKKGAGCNPRL
jgi:hypothetical protein